jgi:hypothetical protein
MKESTLVFVVALLLLGFTLVAPTELRTAAPIAMRTARIVGVLLLFAGLATRWSETFRCR